MLVRSCRGWFVALPLALGLALLTFAAGCQEERTVSGGGGAAATAPESGQEEVQRRAVIGQKTQDIRNFDEEMENPNAKVASQKIVAKDPITLQGNAYVSMIGQISIQQIDYAIKLFEAQEGRYPEDHEEFMERIIRENNIQLPQLPGYQEYSYDEKNHKLVILEYPDRKQMLLEQGRQIR